MVLNFNTLFPTLNKVDATGVIRTAPEDFNVTEINNVELSGSGEHLWLYLQKIGSNTEWVANKLANVCQVPRKQIGFAGMKDRHAITKQWFSIQLAKVSDIEAIQSALPDDVTVLKSDYHYKKIKIGQLESNHFEIVIRNIVGSADQIEQNIQNIIENGVPNYFGPQRFGHDLGNIQKCQDWFSGNYKVKSRNLKSLLISTSRSHIFNTIVAQRINNNTWNTAIDGDILQLDRSHSWFPISDATPAEISKRLNEFDVHLTAAMYGEDGPQSTGECAELELSVASEFQVYQQGFERFRLKQDRRAMRICANDFTFKWINNDLYLSFNLAPGSYATGVMREILTISDHNG